MLYLSKRIFLLACLLVTGHLTSVHAIDVCCSYYTHNMLLEDVEQTSKEELLYKVGVDAYSRGQYVQAKKYFLMAIEFEHVPSLLKLAHMYYEGKGVPKLRIFAAKYFNTAAKKGNAEAQEWVAYMYYNGEGLEQNYGKALLYYHQAAASGRASALYNLARMYQMGHGVRKDIDRAVEYYRLSANRGYKMAEQVLTELGR